MSKIQKLDWLDFYSKEELKCFLEELIHFLNYDFNKNEKELNQVLDPKDYWQITIHEWKEIAEADNLIDEKTLVTVTDDIFKALGYSEKEADKIKLEKDSECLDKYITRYLIDGEDSNEFINEAHEFTMYVYDRTKSIPEGSKVAFKAKKLLTLLDEEINTTGFLRWFYGAYDDILYSDFY